MRVLFVSSGNKGYLKVLVSNQASSLRSQGVAVEHFLIRGRGLLGYLGNVPRLRKDVKSGNYDIVHAHYSLSGFIAAMAGCKNLVVSLMGSDAYQGSFMRFAERLCYACFWKKTIVKTQEMKALLKMPKAHVIPNGVDLEEFFPMPKTVARKQINYHTNNKLILFVADPLRPEKNFKLAQQAVQSLNRCDIELMPVFNVTPPAIPFYMNAADVLLLTSEYEGSVNVIKEAMACNLSIVSTDVGDVKRNISGVTGCYICEKNPFALAEGLAEAIKVESNSNGREKLISLKLDSESIAKEIFAIYEQISERSQTRSNNS
jgi:glycosyltransferase involved in cell wall biosynthesis